MGRERDLWTERRKLTKHWFMSLPVGHCVLTNTYPFEHIELTDDREQEWKKFRTLNTGRMVYAFSNKRDCLLGLAESEASRKEALSERRR